MSVERLITEHMNVWTGAVTQRASGGRGGSGKLELTGVRKLRELILDLAFRGQLVQQETDDEPASALLARIEAEQRDLVARREMRKPKAAAKIEADEIPFALPSSWVWCRLSAVGRDWGQKEPDQPFTYIDVSAIDNQSGMVSNPSVVEPEQAPSRARKLVRSGTLVYSTVRPYLKNIAVVEANYDPEPIASTAFAIIHPLGGMPTRYLLHYLRSPTFVRYVESVQSGIAYPAVNDKQFFLGLVPLPPLAEQHRIVQKVDELMALCDRLEQQTGDQIEAHERLVDTLLETLTRAENATELAENWARVAQHFDTLFTTEHSIDRLKQTILQLAVMGRLVQQHVSDEPADAFIHQVESERKRLIKLGRIRMQRTRSNREVSHSVELPPGWAKATIGDLIYLVSGQHLKADEYFENPESGSIPYLTGPAEFGRVSPNPTRFTKERRAVAQAGDILITCKGSGVGKLNIASCETAISRQLMAARPIVLSTDFLGMLLASLEEQIRRKIVGIAIPGISREDILDAPIMVPPLAEQARIVKKYSNMVEVCGEIHLKIGALTSLRNRLACAVVEATAN